MKSIYKKILSIGLLGVIFEFAFARNAHAFLSGTLVNIGSDFATTIIQVVLGVLAYLAQKIFMLGGMLIELAMRLNNNILDPNSNVFLFRGWTVFVNVADLALVVSLIIIAFATMLNSQTYGMKKALPRLIVMALLVNFSLVIPGVFMDLSGMVTEFFVKQSGLDGNNITSALASAFDISGFLSTKGAAGGVLGSVEKFGSGLMSVMMSAAFIVIFTLVAAVIMLTIAILLFVRYFMLTFLLVLTPIIFVAWIFPGTKKHWSDWWNRFIRWTMFPPVMIFFMWLSLTSLSAFKNAAPTTVTDTYGNATYAFGDGLLFNLSSVVQMAMAVMLMIMSLIAANSISISGAKGGKDMIGSMTSWGQDRIKGMRRVGVRESERVGRRTGTLAIRGAGSAGKWIENKSGGKLVMTAEGMRKYESEKGGVRGRIAGAAGRAGGQISAAQQAALKKTFDEKFKDMSDDNLALRYSTMSTDEKVFAAQRLAKSGKLDKIDETTLEKDIVSMKGSFAQYGDSGTHGKIEKAAGKSAGMIATSAKKPKAQNAFKDGVAQTDEAKEWQKEWDKTTEEFYKNFASAQDYASISPKVYTGDSDFSKEARKRMATDFPGAIAKVAAKVKKADMVKFSDAMKSALEESQKAAMDLLVAEATKDMDSMTGVDMTSMKDIYEHMKKNGTPAQLTALKAHDYKKLIKIQESFDKSMFNRLFEKGEEQK